MTEGMFTFVSEEGHKFVKKEATEIPSRTIEDQLAHIVSQIAKEEEEYLAEQNIQKQVTSLLCTRNIFNKMHCQKV